MYGEIVIPTDERFETLCPKYGSIRSFFNSYPSDQPKVLQEVLKNT